MKRSDTKKRARVFISYSISDQPLASEIASELARRGHSVVTGTEVLPGTDLTSQLRKQIESADIVIFLVSRDALVNPGFTFEIATAIALRSRGRAAGIIPVRLDKDVQLPIFLARYQFLDATHPTRLTAIADAVDAAIEHADLAFDSKQENDVRSMYLRLNEDLLRTAKNEYARAFERREAFLHRIWSLVALLGAILPIATTAIVLPIRFHYLRLILPAVVALLIGYAVGRRGLGRHQNGRGEE